MPSIEQLGLRQFVVYWELKGKDAYGTEEFRDPIQLRAQWNDEEHRHIPQIGVSDVSLVVSRKIVVGSLCWKGKISDVPNTSDFSSLAMFQVIDYQETPDHEARNFFREAILMKRGSRIPEE